MAPSYGTHTHPYIGLQAQYPGPPLGGIGSGGGVYGG
jgi:hypothetical protein